MAWLGLFYRYGGFQIDCSSLYFLVLIYMTLKNAELGMLRGDNASYKALYFAAL